MTYDVVEAVTKFDAIRPSRCYKRGSCTRPSKRFGLAESAPTKASEGGSHQIPQIVTVFALLSVSTSVTVLVGVYLECMGYSRSVLTHLY